LFFFLLPLDSHEGGPLAGVVPRSGRPAARAAERAARVAAGQRAGVGGHAAAQGAAVQEEEREADLHGEGAQRAHTGKYAGNASSAPERPVVALVLDAVPPPPGLGVLSFFFFFFFFFLSVFLYFESAGGVGRELQREQRPKEKRGYKREHGKKKKEASVRRLFSQASPTVLFLFSRSRPGLGDRRRERERERKTPARTNPHSFVC
jgi:hypothetical protein